MVVFEWEGLGLESFWNYTSLSLYVYRRWEGITWTVRLSFGWL